MRAKDGKILNIGSIVSLFGTTYGAGYAASKGGIVQLGRALAVEWAPQNIQVMNENGRMSFTPAMATTSR